MDGMSELATALSDTSDMERVREKACLLAPTTERLLEMQREVEETERNRAKTHGQSLLRLKTTLGKSAVKTDDLEQETRILLEKLCRARLTKDMYADLVRKREEKEKEVKEKAAKKARARFEKKQKQLKEQYEKTLKELAVVGDTDDLFSDDGDTSEDRVRAREALRKTPKQ